MCTIAIDQTSIVATQAGNNGAVSSVSISGTISNCASNEVMVTVTCGPHGGGVYATVSGNTWTATVFNKCACGSTVTIAAMCVGDPNCMDTIQTVLNCGCCPTANTTPSYYYDNSGNCTVQFSTLLTFSANCTVVVEWNWGDGTFGAPHSASSSPDIYTDYHTYPANSNYVATLNVLSHVNCGLSGTSVSILQQAPPCATSQFMRWLCQLAQFSFPFTVAILAVFAFLLPTGCVPPPVPLLTALGVAAVVLFAFMALFCAKCTCNLIPKMIGVSVLAAGVVIALFAAQPNCAVPSIAYPSGIAVLLYSGALILAGAAFLYYAWFKPDIAACNLSVCDYWRCVFIGLAAGIFAALFIHSTFGIAYLLPATSLSAFLTLIGPLSAFVAAAIIAC